MAEFQSKRKWQEQLEGQLKTMQDRLEKSERLRDAAEGQLKTVQKQLASLKKDMSPRRIQKNQAHILINSLASNGPYIISTINAPLGDTEAIVYARELRLVIEQSGWKVEEGITQAIFSSPVKGIWIRFNSEQPMPLGANILIDILNKNGIKVRAEPRRDHPPNSFSLVVGAKP